MQATMNQASAKTAEKCQHDLFIVLCASGFENIARARSALMFAALAASADYCTVLYCIQNAVDLMVKGRIEEQEKPQCDVPTLRQRLDEALEMGVKIQCCTQTMANKIIREDELIAGVKAAGAMSLIEMTSRAKGSLSF